MAVLAVASGVEAQHSLALARTGGAPAAGAEADTDRADGTGDVGPGYTPTSEILDDGTQVGLALDRDGRPFAYQLDTDGRLLVDGPLASSPAELPPGAPLADIRPDRFGFDSWGVGDASPSTAEALFPPGTTQMSSGGLAVTKWVQKYTGGILVRHFVTIPVNYTCEGCTCTIAAIGDAISNMPGTQCETVGESASESVTCSAEASTDDCPDGQVSEAITVVVECCDQEGNCKVYYIEVDACPK